MELLRRRIVNLQVMHQMRNNRRLHELMQEFAVSLPVQERVRDSIVENSVEIEMARYQITKENNLSRVEDLHLLRLKNEMFSLIDSIPGKNPVIDKKKDEGKAIIDLAINIAISRQKNAEKLEMPLSEQKKSLLAKTIITNRDQLITELGSTLEYQVNYPPNDSSFMNRETPPHIQCIVKLIAILFPASVVTVDDVSRTISR